MLTFPMFYYNMVIFQFIISFSIISNTTNILLREGLVCDARSGTTWPDYYPVSVCSN